MRRFIPIVCSMLAWLAEATPLVAQASNAGQHSSVDRVQWTGGYEIHRDHLRYTFENRSNVDTDFLVPHSFTQRYVASNQWFAASARYAIRGDVMETEFGLTPERQTAGADFDTFFDPNSDVVMSGTNGDVQLRSWHVAHWSEGRVFGVQLRAGYSFRRDRAQFLPTDRIVTHTNPPSETRSPTFGRETTISQMHEIPVEATWSHAAHSSWTLTIRATTSPLIVARLVTKLPDKYPGQDIVFIAKGFGVGGGVQLVHVQQWPVTVFADVRQVWGYVSARQVRLDSLIAGARISF